MISNKNNKMQRYSFIATKQFLSLIFIFLPCLSACSSGKKLPTPPFIFPFDTQKANFKIETDMRIVDYDSFQFGFRLGFKEGNQADRSRVVTLAGKVDLDKEGKRIFPGKPIALRIKIRALKPSSLEGIFEKEFIEQRPNGCSATHCYIVVTDVKLRPGTYHLVIENLKEVPDLQGTPVTLYMDTDPKSYKISD